MNNQEHCNRAVYQYTFSPRHWSRH